MSVARSLQSTLKLPRSKSPFNEKTIFVETERDCEKRAFKFTRERSRSFVGFVGAREWEIKALQRLPSPIGVGPPLRVCKSFSVI